MHSFTPSEKERLLAADESTVNWLKNLKPETVTSGLFLLFDAERWEQLEFLALHPQIKPLWTSYSPKRLDSSNNLLALSMYFLHKM